MKKIISFSILYVPWLFSIIFLPFITNVDFLIIIYISLSIIFYFCLSLFLYNLIKYDLYNKDILLSYVLIWIITQSFNIILFYFNNYIFSLINAILLLITFKYLSYNLKK